MSTFLLMCFCTSLKSFDRVEEPSDSVGINFLVFISDSHENEWKYPWALWIPYEEYFGCHFLKGE